MIELQHVSKTFENAGGRVDALRDVSLTIADGDIYGIIGMSGAGKSTLVRCINMLERPTEGRVIVNGQQLDAMTPAQLRAARRSCGKPYPPPSGTACRACWKTTPAPPTSTTRSGSTAWSLAGWKSTSKWTARS